MPQAGGVVRRADAVVLFGAFEMTTRGKIGRSHECRRSLEILCGLLALPALEAVAHPACGDLLRGDRAVVHPGPAVPLLHHPRKPLRLLRAFGLRQSFVDRCQGRWGVAGGERFCGTSLLGLPGVDAVLVLLAVPLDLRELTLHLNLVCEVVDDGLNLLEVVVVLLQRPEILPCLVVDL